MENSLSLYTIEQSLLELLSARADLAGQPNPDPAEVKAVEDALAEYVSREILGDGGPQRRDRSN